ncbi:MAG: hypothetical protein EKK36_02080, partial [Bradyrhizobiaceae bacterium]
MLHSKKLDAILSTANRERVGRKVTTPKGRWHASRAARPRGLKVMTGFQGRHFLQIPGPSPVP